MGSNSSSKMAVKNGADWHLKCTADQFGQPTNIKSIEITKGTNKVYVVIEGTLRNPLAGKNVTITLPDTPTGENFAFKVAKSKGSTPTKGYSAIMCIQGDDSLILGVRTENAIFDDLWYTARFSISEAKSLDPKAGHPDLQAFLKQHILHYDNSRELDVRLNDNLKDPKGPPVPVVVYKGKNDIATPVPGDSATESPRSPVATPAAACGAMPPILNIVHAIVEDSEKQSLLFKPKSPAAPKPDPQEPKEPECILCWPNSYKTVNGLTIGAPRCFETVKGAKRPCFDGKKLTKVEGAKTPSKDRQCAHRKTLQCLEDRSRWHYYHPSHVFRSRRLAQVSHDYEAPSLVGAGLLSSALLAGAYLMFRCLRKSRDKSSPPLSDDDIR